MDDRELLPAWRGIVKRSLTASADGDADVLRAEFVLGRVNGLIAMRRTYNARAKEIRQVMARMTTLRRRANRADKVHQNSARAVQQWDSEGEAVTRQSLTGFLWMILKTNSLWLVVVVVSLSATPAAAQISAPREAAQIQLGPVGIYPAVMIADAGIDDNVFNDSSAPERDYTMTVAARILAVVRLGSNELLFQTGNEYVWFQEFSSERSSNAQYAMRFNLSASRFKPFIGVERLRTRARRSPEIDARARQIDRVAQGGLGFDLTPRTGLTASVRFDDVVYDEGEEFRGVELDAALNRTGRAAGAGVRYDVTPLTTLNVTAGYEEHTFKESHLRDHKRYTVGPAVEFSPEAAIRGRAVAALELFKPEDPTLAERIGLAYDATLNWSLYGQTIFDLGAGRNISYSYQDIEPYYLLTNVRLTVSQPLPAFFEFYGGFDWEHMAYRWRSGSALESDRVDTLRAAHGGVGVHLGSVRVRVGIERTRRRSVEEPLQNFSRTRIMSTVTLGS